jgi:hypothetical protein
LLGHGCFFSFLILYTVGRTTWTADQPVARPLPVHNTDAHALSGVRASEGGSVHASDRAATVIDRRTMYASKYCPTLRYSEIYKPNLVMWKYVPAKIIKSAVFTDVPFLFQ